MLIFADQLTTDLARRQLPWAAHPLFSVPQKALAHGLNAELHLFTSCGSSGAGLIVHRQIGASFAERFENAVERLAQLGFDEIVAIGRDCPQLEVRDVARAFAELATKCLVLGPDHRGGCYLIALRTTDRELLRGIRWKRNTDCVQLQQRCGPAGVFLLPVKHDLDSWADLRLLGRTGDAVGRFAEFLSRMVCAVHRELAIFVDLAAQLIRVRGQMPPPVSAV